MPMSSIRTEYEMRKAVDLENSVIEKLKKLAKENNRSLKNYLEFVLIEDSKKVKK